MHHARRSGQACWTRGRVIALQGQPCGQLVSATKQGDNDYIAVCNDGSRYHVFINEGRVVVQKL